MLVCRMMRPQTGQPAVASDLTACRAARPQIRCHGCPDLQETRLSPSMIDRHALRLQRHGATVGDQQFGMGVEMTGGSRSATGACWLRPERGHGRSRAYPATRCEHACVDFSLAISASRPCALAPRGVRSSPSCCGNPKLTSQVNPDRLLFALGHPSALILLCLSDIGFSPQRQYSSRPI